MTDYSEWKVLDAWCHALESGRYKKTKEVLCEVEKGRCRYCTSGVLLEIIGIKKTKEQNDKKYYYDKNQFDCISGHINMVIGLSYSDEREIYKINDNTNLTFKEISKHIRENIKSKTLRQSKVKNIRKKLEKAGIKLRPIS